MNCKAKTKTGAAIKAVITTIIMLVILTSFTSCGTDKKLKEDQDKFIIEHNCTPDVITRYPSGELITKYSCDKGYNITTSSMNSSDPRSVFYKNNQNNTSSSGLVTGMVVGSLLNGNNNYRPAWRSSPSRNYSSFRGKR